jgi:Na+/H+-dicarboxylate symporter
VSLSTQVLIGLLLGIATGAFLGERAAALQIVGDAFIMLLQMTVMPFIAVSLVAALGRLDASSARELGLKAGAFLLVVWGLILVVVAALPLAFPPMEAASFFSSSLVAEPEPFDFLALYIPSNPIYALSHNVVPALVLFSVVLGVAIIPISGKEGILRALGVLTETLTNITGYVARLAPLGVYALISSAAGTIGLAELERLQVYVVVYALIAVVMTFVILPGLVTALTPLTWREVVPPIRDAIITAFAAGNLLIVIPILTRQAAEIASAKATESSRAESAVDVIVPASFNFPSAGKLLSLGFLPFAAWFTGSSIALTDYPQFLVTGLFTFFGHTSVAIPFLLDLLRLPGDLFEIFLAVDVITGRFQVMMAAMCTVALALLGGFAMSGSLKLNPIKILRFAGVSAAVVAATLLGVRALYGMVLNLESTSYRAFIEMDWSKEPMPWKMITEEPSVPNRRFKEPRLERIDREGVLRVCYVRDALPFAFVNAASHLVGFDVEMAHDLARELGVSVEFIRVDLAHLPQHLDGGTCDIAMSGLAITPDRTRKMAYSMPYLETNLSVVVRDHERHAFASWKAMREKKELRLIAPPSKHFISIVQQRLPNVRITEFDEPRSFFRGEQDVDGLLYSAEAGSAWTLVYPSFSVVVPEPGRIKIPFAYPLPKRQGEFKTFVDTWLALKIGEGAVDALFEHWILGRAASAAQRRWSVLDDVILAGRGEAAEKKETQEAPSDATEAQDEVDEADGAASDDPEEGSG